MATLRFARSLLVRGAKQFISNKAPQNAAAISYYVLFSIIPLLIFIIGAAGVFFGSESHVRQDIIDEVIKRLPFSQDEGRRQVENAVNGIKGPGGGLAGLVALIGALWGATAMLSAMRTSLN